MANEITPRTAVAGYPLMRCAMPGLWAAIEDHKGLRMLANELHAMNAPGGLIDALRDCNGGRPNIPRSREYLHQELSENCMTLLLHAIPRKLLKSVIRRTVARDLENGTIRREDKYDREGAGIYVVPLSIKGRGGKFLTGAEAKEVEKRLQWVEYGFGDGTGSAPPGRTYARSRALVDAETIKNLPENAAPKVAQLRAMFRNFTTGVADDDSYLEQSPMYTGCTDSLGRRGSNYDDRIKISWAMLMLKGVIENACPSLEVELDFVPVLQVWKNGTQLKVAEVLVMLLGQTHICQSGLNIQDCGNSKSPENINEEKAEKSMLDHYPFFRENTTDTKQECVECKEFTVKMATLQRQATQLQAKIEALQRQTSANAAETVAKREEAIALLNKTVDEVEKCAKAQGKVLKIKMLICEWEASKVPDSDSAKKIEEMKKDFLEEMKAKEERSARERAKIQAQDESDKAEWANI